MPTLESRSLDPRIRRTRLLLQDGLRKVLSQKPLGQILVQDITEAATVNRATFYDHYADKYDLFNATVSADFNALVCQRRLGFETGCSSALAALILAVADFLLQLHRDQAACTRQASAGPLLDAAVTLAIQRIILDGLQNKSIPTRAPREAVAAMVAAAVYAAVKEWLVNSNWHVDEDALLTLVPVIHPLIERASL